MHLRTKRQAWLLPCQSQDKKYYYCGDEWQNDCGVEVSEKLS